MTEQEIRTKHFDTYCKYELDQNYFQEINSHTKAQVLGMLYADGCIKVAEAHSSVNLTFGLAEEDNEYVEFVQRQLQTNRPVQIIPPQNGKTVQNTSKLTITNKFIVSDLEKLGCHQRKTKTLTFPDENQVPKEFWNSFILGFFEGDGSIYRSVYNCFVKNKHYVYPCWGFGMVGTESMLLNIQQILCDNSNLPKNKLVIDNRVSFPFYSLVWNGAISDKKNKLQSVFDYLYKDVDFYMERKHATFQFLFKEKLEYNAKRSPIGNFTKDEYDRRVKILTENTHLPILEVAKLIGIKDYSTIREMYIRFKIPHPRIKKIYDNER